MLRPVTPATVDSVPARLRVTVVDHAAGLAGGEVALARLLHALDRDRFDATVILLAPGPLEDRLRADGIRVVVLPTSEALTTVGRTEAVSSPVVAGVSALRSLAAVPRLATAIRRTHADLVVANSLKSAVLVAFAAPLAGRRWVWHLHDRIAPDYLPRQLVGALRSMARVGPRLVVANSAATRSTLPRLADRRVVVAYPGLEITPSPTPRETSPAASFGLLGRIAPTKGQTEFLRAAALLLPQLPSARFTVIGDAMFNDADFAVEVRALPAELGITDSVVFTGWATEPIAAIRQLTSLVHASPVPEPFGQVLVEAMLEGVPVIGTNAGGVPEILDPDGLGREDTNGVIITPLGVLVRPADPASLASAMNWTTTHPHEVAEMAIQARTSAAARFDIRQSARIIEAAWLTAARGRR
jgi:glycosyltransferase involved in cell wall biosynthesis